MKTLKSLPLIEADYADIQKQLGEIFYRIIFKPIVDLLAPQNKQMKKAAKEFRNAKDDIVVAAILSGQIQYVDSEFSGDFTAAVSSALRGLGAQYNKHTGTFGAVPETLPASIIAAEERMRVDEKKLHDGLQDLFNRMLRGLNQTVKGDQVNATKTISKLDAKFDKTYGKEVPKAISVDELSAAGQKQIVKDYSNNMDLWVNKFSREMIHELRGIVEENAATGYRYDKLISKIQGRFSVSQSKAEFLARQETSLFVSKHREARFADAGITSYIWRTAGDSTVREDHRKLNGRTFEFSNPPIVDEATGRRANPGEDFNCRCVSEPILAGVLANA